MGISVSSAHYQANRINQYRSTLEGVRNTLYSFKSNLNVGWQAQEMVYINDAIESIIIEIASLANSLSSLSNDIINVAGEIKQEEEAAEAAAARAATLRR